MTKQEIIKKFNLYIDDTSELSEQEESDLFDKVYSKLLAGKKWEILKSSFTGTLSNLEISIPTDFASMAKNQQINDYSDYGQLPCILVGDNYLPVKLINFSERRKYINRTDVAFIDIANKKIIFLKQPISNQVEFDYFKTPTPLTANQTPIFPTEYHQILVNAMCIDSFIIQQSDKAKSYEDKHRVEYIEFENALNAWNNNLILM